MKYSVGQKVKIRSLEWHQDNVNRYGIIECGKYEFFEPMNEYCGKVVTIKRIDDDNYRIDADKGAFCWTDEMIEGLMEEPVLSAPNITEGVFIHEKDMKWTTEYILPDGYIFKDENGNVINAQKIVLEKKKKEYPKTYEECCEVMNVIMETEIVADAYLERLDDYELNLDTKIENFRKLLICRDAYWKIAGEEMGLGKPWAPDWANQKLSKYCIASVEGRVINAERYIVNTILTFPTIETRDAFYEYFKSEIESCKELL